jgi:hypothetical protein
MAVHNLDAIPLECGGSVIKQKNPRRHRVTLDKAMKQAAKAGTAISGATINPDGSVSLTFGTPTGNNGAEPRHHQLRGWEDVQ